MAFSGSGAAGGAVSGAAAGSAAGPWGALAGGVIGGLAGGFLGGGKKKSGLGPEGMINWNYKNYVKQVQAVRDAGHKFGFHPLALMGNMSAGQTAPVQGQSWQGDWASDAIASGLGTGAELYADDVAADREDDRRFDAILQEQNRVGADIAAEKANEEFARAQLEEIRSRTALNQMRMQAIGAAQPMSTDANKLQDAFGNVLQPSNTGAQDYADQYGDIISEGYGITNWLKDTFTNRDTGEGKLRPYLFHGTGPRPGTRFNPGQ